MAGLRIHREEGDFIRVFTETEVELHVEKIKRSSHTDIEATILARCGDDEETVVVRSGESVTIPFTEYGMALPANKPRPHTDTGVMICFKVPREIKILRGELFDYDEFDVSEFIEPSPAP